MLPDGLGLRRGFGCCGGGGPVVLGGLFFEEGGVGGLGAGGAVGVEGADADVGVVHGNDLFECCGLPLGGYGVEVEVLLGGGHGCCVGCCWLMGVGWSVVAWCCQRGRAAGQLCQMSSRRGAAVPKPCSPV